MPFENSISDAEFGLHELHRQDKAALTMHCWARYLFIAVVSVLGIGQMIAACGQKGDLYLPEPEQAVSPKTTKEAEADPRVKAGAGPEAKAGDSAAAEAGLPGQN